MRSPHWDWPGRLFSVRTGPTSTARYPDPQPVFVHERIRRNLQIFEGRPLSDPAGSVEIRPMAETEPAVMVTQAFDWLAARVGALSDHDDPLSPPHPRVVRLRIGQCVHRRVTRRSYLRGRPVPNEHPPSLPRDAGALPRRNAGEFYVDTGNVAAGGRRIAQSEARPDANREHIPAREAGPA